MNDETFEELYKSLREAASDVLDLLTKQGSPSPECWEKLCMLTGRYCEPYLSYDMIGGDK